MENKDKLIFKKIPKIMGLVGAISKDRKNTAQNYSFRGIDDMYNALNEHLAKEEVFAVCVDIHSEETTHYPRKGGGTLFYYKAIFTWQIYASDGSSVQTTTVGKGMDSSDKDANKAMSTAYKYALMQVFCIPTEEPKDPENDSHEIQLSEPAKPQTTQTTQAKPAMKVTHTGKKILQNNDVIEVNGTTYQYRSGVSAKNGKEWAALKDMTNDDMIWATGKTSALYNSLLTGWEMQSQENKDDEATDRELMEADDQVIDLDDLPF